MLLELHGTLFRIAAQSEGKSTTCQGSRVSLAVTKAKRGCPHFLSCSHYWLKNRAVSSGKQCIDGCFSDFPSEIHSPIYAVFTCWGFPQAPDSARRKQRPRAESKIFVLKSAQNPQNPFSGSKRISQHHKKRSRLEAHRSPRRQFYF